MIGTGSHEVAANAADKADRRLATLEDEVTQILREAAGTIGMDQRPAAPIALHAAPDAPATLAALHASGLPPR